MSHIEFDTLLDCGDLGLQPAHVAGNAKAYTVTVNIGSHYINVTGFLSVIARLDIEEKIEVRLIDAREASA